MKAVTNSEEEVLTAEKEWEIVKRTRKNKSSFKPLYEKYHPKIYRYVLSTVNNEDLAQDLTSATFEKALTKISYFRWQGLSFNSWIYRIARNTIYDYFRTNKSNKKYSLDESLTKDKDNTDYEADIIKDERESKLYELMSTLEEKDQYLLYYKYYEGLKNKEISDLMGLSVENVATKMHRIRKKLKVLMQEDENYDK